MIKNNTKSLEKLIFYLENILFYPSKVISTPPIIEPMPMATAKDIAVILRN